MSTMPYALVQDVPASWENYRVVAAALSDATPEGLIVHVAGRTDEGFRMIDVWESRDAWERYSRRSHPVVDHVVEEPRVQTMSRDLRVEHLLRGSHHTPSRP